MNCTKYILLGATALMSAAPQMANAQSAPGSAVVFLPNSPDSETRECRNASNTGTRANAISGDGTTVAGTSGNIATCAVLWTNGNPAIARNGNSEISSGAEISQVTGLSGDGRVIIGYESGPLRKSRYLVAGGVLQQFSDPAVNQYIRLGGAVDNDGTYFALESGSVVAGNASDFRAWRWSRAGGYESLGNFGSQWDMFAEAISGDGQKIAVGGLNRELPSATDGFQQVAGFWTPATGLVRLADLSSSPVNGTEGSYSRVFGISRNGSTIVGASRGADGFVQATYWRGNEVVGLGYISGAPLPTGRDAFAVGATRALASNLDGSVIVGKMIGAQTDRAFRWTAASGMQDLNLFAANAGINLGGYILADALGLSDNGHFITGNASNGAQFRGYVFSIAQVPTTLSTTARLIVTLRLPGVTQTSIVNQTFNTHVDALLNGANIFTRTVTDPINGAGGVTALADARAALQVGSGLRRVVIGAPTLLSNVTTVLGTTNNTVDVASGTTTSTATVNTFGPAMVATGDLGTCATAAANNVGPTGCSLPGTPVTVDAGILNSNVFTNTINSVTPTTTPTINQLITARWQVSATGGNQFGTVHALVGPAAFERGDRLVRQLLNMGGGSSSAASGIARAAMPMRNESGLGSGKSGLTMFGGYFGTRSSIDADASIPVARVKGNSDGFVLGLQQELGDAAHIGIAVDHGSSVYDVRDPLYPETLNLKHTQAALFAGWSDGGFSLSGAASYGFGTARTSLSTPTTPATGSRDINSWSLGAQVGYAVSLGKDASLTPHIGVRHTSAKLKGFTETGGLTPLLGLPQTVNRTLVYAGLEAEAALDLSGLTLTPRVHGRIARDSGDASGTVDLVFASAGGPVMQALGPGVGKTVAEIGGGLDASVSRNVHLWAGYDGTFRDHAKLHTAKVGLTVRW